MLSVCMISYNHKNFIEEAIKGVVKQITSFPFELIISDDASTDRTNETILEATQNLPDYITLRYFPQETNLGMINNVEFALNACNDNYIAVCEGDDYWVGSNKNTKASRLFRE